MITVLDPITAVLYLKSGKSAVVMQDPEGNEFCRT
jgi:hypothetical protein